MIKLLCLRPWPEGTYREIPFMLFRIFYFSFFSPWSPVWRFAFTCNIAIYIILIYIQDTRIHTTDVFDSPLPLEPLCFWRKAAELQQSHLVSHTVLHTPTTLSPSNHNDSTTLSHTVYLLSTGGEWCWNSKLHLYSVILSRDIEWLPCLSVCIGAVWGGNDWSITNEAQATSGTNIKLLHTTKGQILH